jgi:hypothetical protein
MGTEGGQYSALPLQRFPEAGSSWWGLDQPTVDPAPQAGASLPLEFVGRDLTERIFGPSFK